MSLMPLREPFTAPVDRDMLPSERREFVFSHRTCVLGYARHREGPSMSVVYYVPTQAGELFVSTMGGRAKAKAVARSGKLSLCVLDERWPFTYLQVYCDATIERDPELVTDVMMGVAWRMSGQELQAAARPMVSAMAHREARVGCLRFALRKTLAFHAQTFCRTERALTFSVTEEAVTHKPILPGSGG